MTTGRVVIIGGGIMGRGIAAALLRAGYQVTLTDPDEASRARAEVELRDLGHPSALAVVDDAGVAVSGADLVIEAVPEDLELKLAVWARLGATAPRAAILASNTSALDIDALAGVVPTPERVLGMHWFAPADEVECVEIVRGSATSPETLERASAILTDAGKRPVVVRNSPGFVANRIQFAAIREALLCLQEGLAEADDIDRIVTTSFGPRLAVLGPLANADLGGLDTYLAILDFLAAELGDRFTAPPILRELVAAGRRGVKSGAGIRDYPGSTGADLAAYRAEGLRRVIAAVHDLPAVPTVAERERNSA